MTLRTTRSLSLLIALGLVVAACGSDASADGPIEIDTNNLEPVTITLVTHDSFVVSDGIFETFTEQTGVSVDVISAGDAGEVVSRAVLTAGSPEGDVMFGIDTTFLQRGLDAELFIPHESPGLADVADELELDPEHRVTPIDVSDVCVNYWIDALDGPPPASLDDLLDYAGTFVTMNPESSSPGFAFLLATIARFGEDGWESYWRELVDGGVTISSGWTEAYYGDFVAGGGTAALVTSYASSPPAEVLFADPPVDVAPTGVLTDSCFRQIEFAGVLAGTEHPNEAAALVDFMLSPTFQADVPLNMFVYPANGTVELPAAFVEFGPLADDPITMTPAEIEAGRLDWTQRWTEIVLAG
jgi:thiamine transport system substrate-binding protein